MVAMNDLIPWINPAATANDELASDETYHALIQSINSTWELEEKTEAF